MAAKVLRFFPFFTLFGLLTFALLLVVQAIGPEVRETASGQLLVTVLRVIIIPRWVMTTLVVIVGGALFGFGGGSFPIWYDILTIPVLFLPYILADIVRELVYRGYPYEMRASPGSPKGNPQ